MRFEATLLAELFEPASITANRFFVRYREEPLVATTLPNAIERSVHEHIQYEFDRADVGYHDRARGGNDARPASLGYHRTPLHGIPLPSGVAAVEHRCELKWL